MMAKQSKPLIFKDDPISQDVRSKNKYIASFVDRNMNVHSALLELDKYNIDDKEKAEAYLLIKLSSEGIFKAKELYDHYAILSGITSKSDPNIKNVHETLQRISDAIQLAGEIEIPLD